MNLAVAMASVQFLADGNSPADVDPTTGHGPEWGKAAPIGLLIIVLLCVAVYFLVKSMNRNLRKVPDSFNPAAKVAVGATAATGTATAGTVTAGTADAGHGGSGRDSTSAATSTTPADGPATESTDARNAPVPVPPPVAAPTSAARPAE